MTLSNGQVAVERGFSVGKSILNVNMSTALIVSKKIVRDRMIYHSVKPHNFEISRQLIMSCNAAYSKYNDILIVAEKAKAKQEVSKEKSKLEVSLKRNELLEVSKSLDEEFVASIRDTEKDERNCFTVLAKGIALKRKSDPAGNYMFKVNNRNTRTRCETCSHLSHLVLEFLLLTLSR